MIDGLIIWLADHFSNHDQFWPEFFVHREDIEYSEVEHHEVECQDDAWGLEASTVVRNDLEHNADEEGQNGYHVQNVPEVVNVQLQLQAENAGFTPK